MKKTFTLLIALLALGVSTWAATKVTWDATDVASVDVSMSGGYGIPQSQTIKDITITAEAEVENDYCHFATPPGHTTAINIEHGGRLTFAPASGNLTRIVITCGLGNVSYSNLTSDWMWNNDDRQLIWSGDAAATVVLAGNNSEDGLYFENIEKVEFTVAPAPGDVITWDASVLANVNVSMIEGLSGDNVTQTFNGITVSAEALANGDNCGFYTPTEGSVWIRIQQDGKLTFAAESGKALASIVISCAILPTYPENLKAGSGWSWDLSTMRLSWSGSAATSVDLECDGSSDGFIFDEITSVVYNVVDGPAPTPDPTIEWESRQVNLVSLSCSSSNPTESTNVIRDIIASLERTNDGSCQFQNGTVSINDCGNLTFQSLAGAIKGIVIKCGDVYHKEDLSSGWTYNNLTKTLTWAGTAAEQVTLSGNLNFTVNSIEFAYSPAATPRLGEQFWGIYDQKYEITGAYTVKMPVQEIDHTLNIPETVEYLGDTYYVTEIADYAFKNNADLPNAYIGANVSRIGAHAFEGCLRMYEVSISSPVVESIGDEAFKDCKLIHAFQCFTLLPPELGSDAFSGDTYLNHINVYEWVTDDYKNATNWSALSTKISAIGAGANIGEQFFFHNQTTTNLYEVTSTSPQNAKVLPYTADVNAIYPITREGTLIIPEEAYYMGSTYAVTGIGANAYKDSARFNMVLMPERVKTIESGAFLNCTGVEKVFFLWDDPASVTWADADKGLEFKTAANGGTKIFVPEGRLAAYQTWAPAWASCMYQGEVRDVEATTDPNNTSRYYRTFYDSQTDYMMPPSVWAHVGYVSGDQFILRAIAFDGQIVPKGTAVVLESETPNYRLIPTGNSAPAYTEQNDLQGTDVDMPVSSLGADADKVYVLGKEANIGGDLKAGMGMYKYTGTTLGAHKAYMILNIPSGSGSSGSQNAPARFLFQHEAETPTGVENVQSDKVCAKVLRDGQLIIIKDGQEYNAQGQIVK